MKLPRFIATTPPPRETGLMRAQDIGALTDVGGAEFRAIEQAGGALKGAANLGFQAFMHRQSIDDIAEAGKATQREQELWNKAETEVELYQPQGDIPLPNDPEYNKKMLAFDTDGREKYLNKLLKDIEKDSTKIYSGIRSPKTRAMLINQRNENYAEKVKSLRAKLNEKLHNYQLGEMGKLAADAARSGNMEASDFYVNKMEEHGLITHTKAIALKKEYKELAITEEIVALYRMGLHDEARKVLETSSLSNEDKEQLDDEIDSDEKATLLKFEDDINDELVRIDNSPDMTQADFNAQAKALKNRITFANIPGTKKRSLLTGLEKWRRGTNEIDYVRILSLNQEMDAAQRSGIVDPTIQNRIVTANLEGAFGGRHRGGQKTYGDMIRRFGKLQFDERAQAVSSVVRAFERENRDDPRLVFLFHQAKNKLITDNPDADIKELFIKTSGLAETYSILPESAIRKKLRTKTPKAMPLISTTDEYDALKKGTQYKDVDGNVGTKR